MVFRGTPLRGVGFSLGVNICAGRFLGATPGELWVLDFLVKISVRPTGGATGKSVPMLPEGFGQGLRKPWSPVQGTLPELPKEGHEGQKS